MDLVGRMGVYWCNERRVDGLIRRNEQRCGGRGGFGSGGNGREDKKSCSVRD